MVIVNFRYSLKLYHMFIPKFEKTTFALQSSIKNLFAPYTQHFTPYAKLLRSLYWCKILAQGTKDRHRGQNSLWNQPQTSILSKKFRKIGEVTKLRKTFNFWKSLKKFLTYFWWQSGIKIVSKFDGRHILDFIIYLVSNYGRPKASI